MRRINSSVLKPVDFASSDAFIIVMAVGGAEYEVCEAVERQPPDSGLSFVAKPNNMAFLLDNLRENGCVYVNLSLVRPTLRTKYRLIRRHERFIGGELVRVPWAKVRSDLPSIMDRCDENVEKFCVVDADGSEIGQILPGVQTPLPLVDKAISSEDFKKTWKTLTGPTPITRSKKLVALYLPVIKEDLAGIGPVPEIDDVVDESVLEDNETSRFDELVEAGVIEPTVVNPQSAEKGNGALLDLNANDEMEEFVLFLKSFAEVMSVDHPLLDRKILRRLGAKVIEHGFEEEVHVLFSNIVRAFEVLSDHKFSEDVHDVLYG